MVCSIALPPPWVKETEEEEEEGLLPILSARKKKDTNRNSTIVQCLKNEKIKKHISFLS